MDQDKVYHPFAGGSDPCAPVKGKSYWTPPQLYMVFQPEDLKQHKPAEALKLGTLWPDLYGPYDPKK